MRLWRPSTPSENSATWPIYVDTDEDTVGITADANHIAASILSGKPVDEGRKFTPPDEYDECVIKRELTTGKTTYDCAPPERPRSSFRWIRLRLLARFRCPDLQPLFDDGDERDDQEDKNRQDRAQTPPNHTSARYVLVRRFVSFRPPTVDTDRDHAEVGGNQQTANQQH